MKTILERFEEKYEAVTESGCWIWTAALWMGGRYGSFWVDKAFNNGAMSGAHRVSLYLYKGLKLSTEEHACHKCDNTLCVNPEHLFVGSHSDNMQDMLDKGRYVAHKQVLFEDDVVKAKELRSKGQSVRSIAKEFNISESHMSRLLRDVYNRHDARKA